MENGWKLEALENPPLNKTARVMLCFAPLIRLRHMALYKCILID